MFSKDVVYILGLLIIIVNYIILKYKEKIKSNIFINVVALFTILYTLTKSIQLGILLSTTLILINQ